MPANTENKIEERTSRTTRSRTPQLKMPENIALKFGPMYHDELQAQGVVKTEDIVELASVMGISDLGHIAFPLQKFGRNDGKDYEFRVEPSGSHSFAGAPIVGHQWMLRQTRPEAQA